MRTHARVAVGSPTVRLAVVVTATVILLLAVAGAVVGAATLAPSPSPSPQPGGLGHNGLIAYDANGDIMVVNNDGSDPRVLIGGPDVDSSPVWSPDGKQIAFWRKSSGLDYLAVADAEGTNVEVYKFPATGGYDSGNPNIDWGPGEGDIMFRNQSHQLQFLDLVSGKTTDVSEIGSRQGFVFGFDWSDDGTKVAFTSWDNSPHYEYVFLANLGTPDPTQLVKADPVTGSLSKESWNRTGDTVAFGRAEDVPGYTGLTSGQLDGPVDVITVDGVSLAEKVIARGTYFCPVWSPDGTQLAAGGAAQVVTIMNADGSNLRAMSQPLGACDVSWSPDGTRLVSINGDAQNNLSLAIADPSGDTPEVTIAAPGNLGGPSWQRLP